MSCTQPSMAILPIGIYALERPLRFPDKDRNDADEYAIDVWRWVAQQPSDPIVALAVTVQPAVPGGVAQSAPVIVGTVLKARLAGGVEGFDTLVMFTAATRHGRVRDFPVRLLVQPAGSAGNRTAPSTITV